jgi:hypothetical protein
VSIGGENVKAQKLSRPTRHRISNCFSPKVCEDLPQIRNHFQIQRRLRRGNQLVVVNPKSGTLKTSIFFHLELFPIREEEEEEQKKKKKNVSQSSPKADR